MWRRWGWDFRMRVARRGSLAWLARRMRREASILGVSVKVGRRGGGKAEDEGRRQKAYILRVVMPLQAIAWKVPAVGVQRVRGQPGTGGSDRATKTV